MSQLNIIQYRYPLYIFQIKDWPYNPCFRGNFDSPYELTYTSTSPSSRFPDSNEVCMTVKVARTCDGLNPGPGTCCAALSADFWKFEIEAGGKDVHTD